MEAPYLLTCSKPSFGFAPFLVLILPTTLPTSVLTMAVGLGGFIYSAFKASCNLRVGTNIRRGNLLCTSVCRCLFALQGQSCAFAGSPAGAEVRPRGILFVQSQWCNLWLAGGHIAVLDVVHGLSPVGALRQSHPKCLANLVICAFGALKCPAQSGGRKL